MDKHIVYSKELSKADTLILKNLEADIKDVSAKPQLQDEGLGNGKMLRFPSTLSLQSLQAPVVSARLTATHRQSRGCPHQRG